MKSGSKGWSVGIEAGFIQRDYEGPGYFAVPAGCSYCRCSSFGTLWFWRFFGHAVLLSATKGSAQNDPYKDVLLFAKIFFYVVCLFICMRRKFC